MKQFPAVASTEPLRAPPGNSAIVAEGVEVRLQEDFVFSGLDLHFIGPKSIVSFH